MGGEETKHLAHNSKRRHKDENALTGVNLGVSFSCCKFAWLNVNTRLSGSNSSKLKVKRKDRSTLPVETELHPIKESFSITRPSL